MSYLLKNLTWIDGSNTVSGDIRIHNGIQVEIEKNIEPRRSDKVLEFGAHFLYPGLINAHDHLEMNLYYRLGSPPYRNYLEWSHDIYKPEESPIREIQRVNIRDRIMWGALKNLISGATTVVHHNPWHRLMSKNDFPVRVVKNITWAHSLALEKNPTRAFRIRESVPFVIHAGEGTDAMAMGEIPQLDTLGLLNKNSVLVHAVALNDTSITTLIERQSSIIWCPSSNAFMLGQTTPIDRLKGRVIIAIGTDSTLTGSPTLLDEIKVCAKTAVVADKDIFKMVTSDAARAFHLPMPTIAVGTPGDLFVTPMFHGEYLTNLMLATPATISAVLVRGELNLLDSKIRSDRNRLKHDIQIGGSRKNVLPNVASLKKRIEQKVSSTVLEKNPLWKLIEV